MSKLNIECAVCSHTGINVYPEERTYDIIVDDEYVSATIVVAVHECESCGYKYTDYQAEIIKDYASKKAVENHRLKGDK